MSSRDVKGLPWLPSKNVHSLPSLPFKNVQGYQDYPLRIWRLPCLHSKNVIRSRFTKIAPRFLLMQCHNCLSVTVSVKVARESQELQTKKMEWPTMNALTLIWLHCKLTCWKIDNILNVLSSHRLQSSCNVKKKK